MNRRKFCRTALAASIAPAIPTLPGCSKKAPVATEADTSIRGISLTGNEIELEKAAIRELGGSMTGPVLLSGHPEYDSARKVWNGMHDKRPALIARCMSSADVSNAITFARERELLTAVRGGGHDSAGPRLVAEWVPVRLLGVDPAGAAIEPLAGRLAAGDRVVVTGVDLAFPGVTLAPRGVEPAAAAAPAPAEDVD